MEKGLIIASFGTTHRDTRIKAISNIERLINKSLSEKNIYSLRAFTSRLVKKRIFEKEELYIFNENEAKKHMEDRGIIEENIYVQPLHLLPGFEFEKLSKMKDVKLGEPLFSSTEDLEQFVDTVPFNVSEKEVLILFGHGTDHLNDRIYKDLQEIFFQKGHKNIFIVCVEGEVSLKESIEKVKELNPEKIILQPLMIVAGDHAKNDMASLEEGSLRYELEKKGFNIESRLIGLGEIPEVVELFIHKADKLINNQIDTKKNRLGYLA